MPHRLTNGLLGRGLLAGLLFALVALGFVRLDALTAPTSASVTPPSVDTARPNDGGRVFVFIIDSLRAKTAQDAEVMPQLVALSERSLTAQIMPGHDAITVMALRAALTGRDRVTIMGFLQNFGHGTEYVPSLLTQLRRAGGEALVYSDGAFAQFGPDAPDRRRNEAAGTDDVEKQGAALAMAVRAWEVERPDLLVFHLTYTDHVAHEHGVGHPTYAAWFGAADQWVRRLQNLMGPDDTLFVMGDHGHDLAGRHMTGLEVPAWLAIHGPRFTEGLHLGTRQITELRYLLGWALGLPLAQDYVAARRPEALVGAPAKGYSLRTEGEAALAHVPRTRWIAFGWTVIGLGLCAALWGMGALRRWRWRALVAGPAIATLFTAWGWLLSTQRLHLHWPEYATMDHVGVAVLVGALVAARRFGVMRVMWPLLGAGLLLGFPTIYRYGQSGLMAPLWLALLGLSLFTGAQRLQRLQRPKAQAWMPALAATLFLLPFLYPYGHNFQFVEWAGPDYERLTGDNLPLLLVAGLTLAWRPRSARATWSGLPATLYMAGLGAQLFSAPWWVSALATTSPLLFGRSKAHQRSAGLLLGAAALWHSGVTTGEAFCWLWCLLAAASLGGHTLQRSLPARQHATAATMVLLLGVLSTGWITLSWSLHRLEWGFIYAMFDAGLVERQVGFLTPLIAGRYLLPLLMLAALVRESLGRPDRWLLPLAGLKTFATLLVAYGMATHQVGTQVFLEATQHATLWALFTVGLVGVPSTPKTKFGASRCPA